MRITAFFAMLVWAGAASASEFQPLTAWHAYDGAGVPPTWTIAGNLISHVPGGGDLASDQSFRNFELTFEWRISPGGNSGVMYRVKESADPAYVSGPEYQILDNGGHPDGANPLTSAASAYGLYAPSADLTRPVGEWNAARIVVDGQHVEHWLNRVEVLSYELGSEDWLRRVQASKFASVPKFGTVASGPIVLQDHGSAVDYRNVMVRALPE